MEQTTLNIYSYLPFTPKNEEDIYYFELHVSDLMKIHKSNFFNSEKPILLKNEHLLDLIYWSIMLQNVNNLVYDFSDHYLSKYLSNYFNHGYIEIEILKTELNVEEDYWADIIAEMNVTVNNDILEKLGKDKVEKIFENMFINYYGDCQLNCMITRITDEKIINIIELFNTLDIPDNNIENVDITDIKELALNEITHIIL